MTSAGFKNNGSTQQQGPQQGQSQHDDVLNPEILYDGSDAILAMLEALKKAYNVNDVMGLNLTRKIVEALPVIAEQLPNIENTMTGAVKLSSNHTPPKTFKITKDKIKFADNNADFEPRDAYEMIALAAAHPKAKDNPLILKSDKPENLYLLQQACKALGVSYDKSNQPKLTPEQEQALDQQWTEGYDEILEDINRLQPTIEDKINNQFDELENLLVPVIAAEQNLISTYNNGGSLDDVQTAFDEAKEALKDFSNSPETKRLEDQIAKALHDNGINDSHDLYERARQLYDYEKIISESLNKAENELIPLMTIEDNTAKLNDAYKDVDDAINRLTSATTFKELQSAYTDTVQAHNNFEFDSNNERMAIEGVQTLNQLGIDDSNILRSNLMHIIDKAGQDINVINEYGQHLNTSRNVEQQINNLDTDSAETIHQISEVSRQARNIDALIRKGELTEAQNAIDDLDKTGKNHSQTTRDFSNGAIEQASQIRTLPQSLQDGYNDYINALSEQEQWLTDFSIKTYEKVQDVRTQLTQAITDNELKAPSESHNIIGSEQGISKTPAETQKLQEETKNGFNALQTAQEDNTLSLTYRHEESSFSVRTSETGSGISIGNDKDPKPSFNHNSKLITQADEQENPFTNPIEIAVNNHNVKRGRNPV